MLLTMVLRQVWVSMGGGGGGCCIALEMCEGLREYATTTTTTDLTGVSEEVKKLSEEGSPCSRPNR